MVWCRKQLMVLTSALLITAIIPATYYLTSTKYVKTTFDLIVLKKKQGTEMPLTTQNLIAALKVRTNVPGPASNAVNKLVTSTVDKPSQTPKGLVTSEVNTVVLTTSNAGFLDITENMLESIRRTGTCPNITVIAEDEQTFQALSKRVKSHPGLHVQKTDSGDTTSEKLMVNTQIYNQLVNKRPAYVLSFLEKGNRVLFVDVDTYWFHDPLKDVKWDFDIALHNEFTAPNYWFCDGFVYYSPTNNTINLVKEWSHLLETKEKDTPDQIIMNRLISKKNIPGLKVKTLNASQFPDGQRYFKTKGWKEKNNDTIVVHLSYVLGHDAKVKTLQQYGYWVI